ncbi:MAG: CopG family antitoxin [Elusimicrobiota bacterium]
MKRGKSSISKAKSYKEIGEFWDTHDLTEYWDQTKSAKFEVDIQSEVTLC